MDFATQCMLAAKGCSEHPCTELVILMATTSAQQEKGGGGTQEEGDVGFLLLTFNPAAAADYHCSPRGVDLHTMKR